MKFILELFAEHIPAHFQKDLKQYYIDGYKKYINIGECSVYCSSRRLVFIIELDTATVKGEMIVLKGPRVDVSRDSISVTKFYESADKIQHIVSKELYVDNGYWHVRVQKKDMSVEEYLLAAFVKMFEEHLPENRMMWYEGQKQIFVRPVRNIFAMLDDKYVEFNAFNLKSVQYIKTNNYKNIQIHHVDEYCKLLKQEGIWIDYDDRTSCLKEYVENVNGRMDELNAPEDMQSEKQKDSYKQCCMKDKLDTKQKRLLEMVAHHDEVIYPFHVTIDYQKYAYMNEIPMDFLYASFDDQMQTMPVYGKDVNAHGEYRVQALIFSSNIPVTEQIAQSTFKVCMSYISDVYDLYQADLQKEFDPEELRNLPTYKIGNMYDRMERLISSINLYKNINEDVWKSSVMWLNVDLLSKTVQEFPKLHGACGAFVLKGKLHDEILRILYNYYICATEREMSVKRLFGMSGYSGFERLNNVEGDVCERGCMSNAKMNVSDDGQVRQNCDAYDEMKYEDCLNSDLLEIIQSKSDMNDDMFAGMLLYWTDVLDVLLGFYVADGEQKIGSKDPFGLKGMIYNTKYIGLMLHIYSKKYDQKFVDLRNVVEFMYEQYEKQGLCKLKKDRNVIIDNVMKIFTIEIEKYMNNEKTYWEKLENAIVIDEMRKNERKNFDLICKVYKRIVNFAKQQSVEMTEKCNEKDAVSVRMMGYVKKNVSLADLIGVSKELDEFFDANRILDTEVASRVCALRELQKMYEMYVCFDDKLIDLYQEKTLIDVLL